MPKFHRFLPVVLVAAFAGAIAVGAELGRWRSHVQVLADDNMEGRNAGSAGHLRAAEYIAAQFKQNGLLPAGVGGYFQPVALSTRRIVEAKSSLALLRDGRVFPLTLGEDANINPRVGPAPALEAPLVFVGYGLKVPEQNIDDLAGVDLKGAIAVYVAATPKTFSGPLQAHFGSAAERWKVYKAAGVVGTISIANPQSMDVPWARSTLARLQPAMSLADGALDDTPSQRLSVTMNPAQVDKLLAGSGHTFEEILGLIAAGQPVPSFALPSRLQATAAVERASVESQNVAGLLRGSDPKRLGEYVVISAHLDHLGNGEPINGDRIYNGAIDNASGIAAMLEVARALHESGTAPARSILFLAVTAEEKGQLGSRHFTAHPPSPAPASLRI